MIELTEQAIQDLANAGELRGLVVELHRGPQRSNSILTAQVVEQPDKAKRLQPPPPWFDDRPSSLFGQFGDEQVDAMAASLDRKLADLVAEAIR